MKYSALIPVKALDLAKSRLAPHLSRLQRVALVLNMLQHVLHILNASNVFSNIYVVSADPRVLDLARHQGAQPLLETQQGHNPALQEAAQAILTRVALQQPAYAPLAASRTSASLVRADTNDHLEYRPPQEGLLTISADLPLLEQEDICALIRAAETHPIVLASSSDGTGTNALLTRPPLAIPYLFGLNSLPAYIQAAQANRLSHALVQTAHLALDIDTLADLAQLERSDNNWLSATRFAI